MSIETDKEAIVAALGKEPNNEILRSEYQKLHMAELDALLEAYPDAKAPLGERAAARSAVVVCLSQLPEEVAADGIAKAVARGVASKALLKRRVKELRPKEVQVVAAEAPEDILPSGSVQEQWRRYGFVLDAHDRPVLNIANVVAYMQRATGFHLHHDTFHHKLFAGEGGRREWGEQEDLALTYRLQNEVGLRRLAQETVSQAARIYAWQHRSNEPRDWMEGLKWDGEKRVEHFLAYYLGAQDTRYSHSVSKNFWTALAARVYSPGCQLDNMMVLEGPQGSFKTTAMRIVGGPWYAESLESVSSKDFFLVLQGKLLVEVAELDSFSKSEATRIKQVITCTMDRYRAPYARTPQDYPRSCVFVGTTNEDQYLRDDTGGRRFWPVRCGQIRVDNLAKDREQLYAEAVALYKGGASWHEVTAEAAVAEQEARRQSDAWEDVLSEWGRDRDKVTMGEAAAALKIEVGKLSMMEQRRIGGLLRRLGWNRHVSWVDGVRAKIWIRQNGHYLALAEPAHG